MEAFKRQQVVTKAKGDDVDLQKLRLRPFFLRSKCRNGPPVTAGRRKAAANRCERIVDLSHLRPCDSR